MSKYRDPSQFRDRKVRLALNRDEYDALKAKADRGGKPMAVLLREAALGDARESAAVKLLKEALFLRMNGERAPGGTETWHDWDDRAERYLRSLLPEPDAAS